MSVREDTQTPARPEDPYKPGALRSIKLENFMCHESFEQEFGPRVSFIIGPNGSGKSALLTALIVALGGRATTTSRARKTSDFVMYGKRFAKITIVLQNYERVQDLKHAFRPDDYGKTIIIEKEIYRDIVNNKEESKMKLVLKNHYRKKVSERKAELDEILQHFGILINNPICILNQEVSKTFLHSKRPEDQYELFMKATTLENIENDYKECKETHQSWNESNNSGQVGFKILDQEYAKCRERTKAIQDRGRIHKTLADLKFELYWSYVQSDQDKCEQLKKKIEICRNEIATSRADIEKQKLDVIKYQEDEQQLKDKRDNFNGLIDETKKKVDDTNRKILNAKTNKISKTLEVERCRKQLHRLRSEKKIYDKAIADIKRTLREQDALVLDEDKRKSDIETLEKEIEHLKSRLKILDNETDQLQASMTERMKDQFTAQSNYQHLDQKIAHSKQHLARLANGQQNVLRRYGDDIVKFVDIIEKYYMKHRDDPMSFTHKPIGPLGYYIKIKNPEIANPLELHLGKTAYAFVCHNTQDMHLLNTLFEKHLYGQPRPTIIVRSFVDKHDVSQYKTKHEQFKTFLDYLEIENDAVFNACIDRSSLENVLYIPDYDTAQTLVLNASFVPANLNCVYTKDCYLMHPINSAGGFRSYAPDNRQFVLFSNTDDRALKDARNYIQQLEADYKAVRERYEHLLEETNTQKRTHADCVKQREQLVREQREKEAALSNLNLVIPTVKPIELKGLEEDLEKCLNKIASEEIQLEEKETELRAIDRELDDLSGQLSECEKIFHGRESQRTQIAKDLAKALEQMETTKTCINSTSDIITKRETELKKLETDLSEAHLALDRSIDNAPNNAPRPDKVRSIEDVKDEIIRLEARIRTLEETEMDPEEVLRNLKRRMVEIENMTDLKDSNITNFKLMSNSIQDRETGFSNLKHMIVCKVSATFASVMKSMRMRGELKIYMDPVVEGGQIVHKGKTLEINIETNYLPNSQRVNSNISHDGDTTLPAHQSQPAVAGPRAKRARLDQTADMSGKENATSDRINMTNTKSLSGGERSFSTVALVLSLWHHCASPFKLMDEIDVFMDMVTRRISYNALINFAQMSDTPGQFIFFSPLELPKFDDPHSMVRVFEMPHIYRKEQQSSLPTESRT